jgi:hypothetical protein
MQDLCRTRCCGGLLERTVTRGGDKTIDKGDAIRGPSVGKFFYERWSGDALRITRQASRPWKAGDAAKCLTLKLVET